ncbi:MAG: glnQ [Cryobacterium sp.]|jgi:cystine transport system ATP-binding protein|nr:glnQ [Cryobacterium sp.]
MSPGEVPALLSVRGLKKSYGANQVLNSVDLRVDRGNVLVLIGSSGSGKTTILRCLNGLEVADGGTVDVSGELRVDFSTHPSRQELASLRDRSAMVFQHYNLFPHLTVLENIIEGPVLVQRKPRAEATAEAVALLERVGLSEKTNSYPFELSGGQQQRVGIVRALALKPQLLLFDEPTSALDPELVGDILRLIKELAEEGWSMVIVTHELEFAREVAHEIAFVDGGSIIERGAPEHLLRNPQQERTKQFLHRLLFPF